MIINQFLWPYPKRMGRFLRFNPFESWCSVPANFATKGSFSCVTHQENLLPFPYIPELSLDYSNPFKIPIFIT